VPAAELSALGSKLEQDLAELDSADNNLNALKKSQAEALESYRKLRYATHSGPARPRREPCRRT